MVVVKALKGLELLHKTVDLSFVERVGLRYLDAVCPKADEQIDKYLTSSLLGLSTKIAGTLNHSYSETQTQIGAGTLIARAVMMENGLSLPPDLFPLHLKLSPQFDSLSGRNATLDIDYFISQRSDFDLGQAQKQLQDAHSIITDVFKASATDYAFKVWE